MDRNQRVEKITKQIPTLIKVPYEERLNVFYRGGIKSPVWWGVFIALLIIWIVLFGNTMLQWEHFDIFQMGIKDYSLAVFKQMLVPALIPVLIIAFIMLMVRNYLVKRIVKKEYLNE
ncbi:hypothetical protein [Sinomicrobium sp.]